MIWCLFEFRSVSIERGTLGEHSSCSCFLSLLTCLVSPLLPHKLQSVPLLPPVSGSRTGVFSDIFSCLVVSDWLSFSYCLPTALHSISEQCHRWSKITGIPSLWARVATEGVFRVDPQAISSHALGDYAREPSGGPGQNSLFLPTILPVPPTHTWIFRINLWSASPNLRAPAASPLPSPAFPPLTQMLPNEWWAWMGPGGQTPKRGEASWPLASILSTVIWQESTSCIYPHICLCLWLVIYSLPFMGSRARAHLNSSQVRLTGKEGWDTQSLQLLMFIEGYAFSSSCCHFS